MTFATVYVSGGMAACTDMTVPAGLILATVVYASNTPEFPAQPAHAVYRERDEAWRCDWRCHAPLRTRAGVPPPRARRRASYVVRHRSRQVRLYQRG